jgi:hypothetical protein
MNRIEIVEKYAGSKEKPTNEELQEAYGYLDSCFSCGKKFTSWDRFTFNISHSILGNQHRRNCK